MQIKCPSLKCTLTPSTSLKTGSVIRFGSYYRRSDSRRIRIYRCKICLRRFSIAGQGERRYQKIRRINHPLMLLMSSGVSQRRAAKILRVNRKTVVRRFRFLAAQAQNEQVEFLKTYHSARLQEIQFDDLETSEHTKCKPLSVALAIEPKSRKILGFQVSQMPAKGRLAKPAFRKYGSRKDERAKGWNQLLKDLIPILSPNVCILSDENPHYPKQLLRHFPNCRHETVPGGRGAITGQGELKKKVFDPMFSLNHTCAMLRANLNRLFRRTWCTTKTRQGLIDHLSLYVRYHNQVLTPPTPFLGAS